MVKGVWGTHDGAGEHGGKMGARAWMLAPGSTVAEVGPPRAQPGTATPRRLAAVKGNTRMEPPATETSCSRQHVNPHHVPKSHGSPSLTCLPLPPDPLQHQVLWSRRRRRGLPRHRRRGAPVGGRRHQRRHRRPPGEQTVSSVGRVLGYLFKLGTNVAATLHGRVRGSRECMGHHLVAGGLMRNEGLLSVQ